MRCWTIPILVVFAWSSYLACQQPTQSKKVSYESQKVATVGATERRRAVLRRQGREHHCRAAEDGTVQQSRSRGQAGLWGPTGELILEPALYFGIFDFPGATKKFSYTRMLQVIDIPNQTLYTQDLVTKADEKLHDFFVSAGYFQAQVQLEPQFDELHMLANVVFHVELGKQAKIGKVEVRGPTPDEANRLLQATRSLRATVKGGLSNLANPTLRNGSTLPLGDETRSGQPAPPG